MAHTACPVTRNLTFVTCFLLARKAVMLSNGHWANCSKSHNSLQWLPVMGVIILFTKKNRWSNHWQSYWWEAEIVWACSQERCGVRAWTVLGWDCFVGERDGGRGGDIPCGSKKRNSRFLGLYSDHIYPFSPCRIDHLSLIIITPRSSHLVENLLFYE